MTKKYDDFMTELEALCRKHKVCISASGYDGLQVWDKSSGLELIHFAGTEDMTEEDSDKSGG